MLKFVYSFFLGLLLAIFVGVGVATFYPEPKAPEYPTVLQTADGKEYTAEQKNADSIYQQKSKAHSQELAKYSRNVSMIVLAAAVLLMILGLALEARAGVLADGLLLGGTFTLLYSVGRSFGSTEPKYSFIVACVGLAVTFVVGYRKFVSPAAPAKKRK